MRVVRRRRKQATRTDDTFNSMILNTMNVQHLSGHCSPVDTSHSFVQRASRVLLFGLLIPFIFAAFAPVFAQGEEGHIAQTDTASPAQEAVSERSARSGSISSATWNANFDAQAATMLEPGHSASIRETVLHNVIEVALQHPDEIDFSSTVDALLEVVEEDGVEMRRLMALQALHVIGTEHAHKKYYRRGVEHLYQIMQEEPCERLRSAAADLLAAVDGNDPLRGRTTPTPGA